MDFGAKTLRYAGRDIPVLCRADCCVAGGGPSGTAAAILAALEKEYGARGVVNKVDGLSVEFPEWRFNLRMSNTEPVIRLNVETRGDKALLREKTDELLAKIRA